ncbi:sigma-54-dependent Fis family transcriptional regulator [Tepidimonas aquatica]|uniref:Acetoin catabolism regulatory protein n=1 Tax=Tepidimonas aquatica TaxID=247482 RepID=A0A554WWE8_9BURK|nr:sigma-54-dependent Fis family transcriptional regulator [Tepidimonas aquatica]TSE27904.1 Acetoin catabolism regulatory protein [Tepidimonas aquatica]
MTMLTPSLESVALARQTFIERGELTALHLAPEIVRSWQRCRAKGLSCDRHPDVKESLVDTPRLTTARERLEEWLRYARPVFESVFWDLGAGRSILVLADPEGVIVETSGDPRFLERAQRVHLARGAIWHEGVRGTNAVGTAIAEGAPVEVLGPEHYLSCNEFLACTAAPIFDGTGRLVAVLDVSCDWHDHHPHTRALVNTAVRLIENHAIAARHRGLRIHLHRDAHALGSFVDDAIVCVDDDGRVVAANSAARRLFSLRHEELGAVPLERLFRRAAPVPRGDEPVLLYDPQGNPLYARFEGRRARVVIRRADPAPANDALAELDTGDEALRRVIAQARRVLDKDIPILLRGESGVGKELFAQALHRSSPRRDKPFVAVNCAALPEALIEAELFGYAPGAYTGARREGSLGRIREAHGGTLFLDEIGDMPLALQGRLLRVLETKEVVPLGGKPVRVEFALIAATHRDLPAEVEAGRFRADLYYRLAGLTLTLPPLRERSDLPVLVERILRACAPDRDLRLAPEVAAAFAAYSWPGNVRELAQALRVAAALVDEEEMAIGWEALPEGLAAALKRSPGTTPLTSPAGEEAFELATLSRAAIERALVASRGNRTAAARRLGISRATLYRKLREMGSPPAQAAG